MNTKTPIMLLQEAAMKTNTLPVYTEVSAVCGTHRNQFTIKVDWNKCSTTGVGSSKKEAKQNAAMQMLLLLTSKGHIPQSTLSLLPKTESNITFKQPVESTTSPTTSSSVSIPNSTVSSTNLSISTSRLIAPISNTQTPLINYVGKLNEYCANKYLPIPVYTVISSVGLSHNIMFTMSCTAASIYKEASATTKKAAKQEVAKKIVEHLERSDTDMNEITALIVDMKVDKPKSERNAKVEEVLENYRQLSRTSGIHTNQLHVSEFHIAFRHLSTTYTKLIQYNISQWKSMICYLTNANIKTHKFVPKEANLCIVGIKLTTVPVLFQIGTGVTEKDAERQALLKIAQLIKVLGS